LKYLKRALWAAIGLFVAFVGIGLVIQANMSPEEKAAFAEKMAREKQQRQEEEITKAAKIAAQTALELEKLKQEEEAKKARAAELEKKKAKEEAEKLALEAPFSKVEKEKIERTLKQEGRILQVGFEVDRYVNTAAFDNGNSVEGYLERLCRMVSRYRVKGLRIWDAASVAASPKDPNDWRKLGSRLCD